MGRGGWARRRSLPMRALRFPARWPTLLLTGASAAFGAAFTALAGLIGQDLLPNSAGTPTFEMGGSTRIRWWAALVLFLLFLWALYATVSRRQDRGSLFYLRLLPRGHEDFHATLSSHKARHHEAFRPLFRRFELDRSLPVLDIRCEVEDFVDEVGGLLAADDRSTATTVAPNVSFPAALALGYGWQPVPNLRLQELNGKNESVSLLADEPGNPNGFPFELARAEEYLQEFLRATDPSWKPSGLDVLIEPGPAGAGKDAVFVELMLSVPADNPSRGRATVLFPRPPVSGSRAGDRRIIGLFSPVTDEDKTKGPVLAYKARPIETVSSEKATVDDNRFGAAYLAALIAWHLRAIHHELPTADLILSARMPKSVAVAVGWLLRAMPACHVDNNHRSTCGFPWKRLTPLLHDDATHTNYPTWIRRDQTNPATVVFGGHDISAGPYQLRNLTLHEVAVMPDGQHATATVGASGSFARVEEVAAPSGTLATTQGSVPVVTVSRRSAILDLPPASQTDALIVSRMTAEASPRTDLYFPYGEVRDAAGRIVGCRALGRIDLPRS